MNFQIGPGGNQISREVWQTAQQSLSNDNQIDAAETRKLREAALHDGEITRTEIQFFNALDNPKTRPALIRQLRDASFSPSRVQFAAQPGQAQGPVTQGIIAGGRIAPEVKAGFDTMLSTGALVPATQTAKQPAQPASPTVSLEAVAKNYRAFFTDPTNQALVERMKKDPIGELLLTALPEVDTNRPQMMRINNILNHDGYIPHAMRSGQLDSYDLKTHAAIQAQLQAILDRPLPAPPGPPPAQEAFKGFPAENAARALHEVRRLTQLGIETADAQQLVSGMAELPKQLFEAQLDLLLNDSNKATTAEQLKQAISLLRSGHVQNVGLKDLGRLLMTQKLPEDLRLDPGNEKDLAVAWVPSSDLGTILKTRLMTYLTLAEADPESQAIAAKIKDGLVQVKPIFVDKSIAAAYASHGLESERDTIEVGYNQPDFAKIDVSTLFAGQNTDRALRSRIVHEGSHAHDDEHQSNGVRIPSGKGYRHYDLEASGQHDQFSFEGEFNGFLKQVDYLVAELKNEGRFSPGAVMAVLGRGLPGQNTELLLAQFLESRRIHNRSFTQKEVEVLYQAVRKDLQTSYTYQPKIYTNDGIPVQR